MPDLEYEYLSEVVANLADEMTKLPIDQDFVASPMLQAFEKRSVTTQGHYIEGDIEFTGGAEGEVVEENSDARPTHRPSLDRFRYLPTLYSTEESINRIRMNKVRGSKAKFNEVQRIMNVCKRRADMKIATCLTAATDAANAGPGGTPGMHTIATILSTTPTSGIVGGINRASVDYWSHYYDNTAITIASDGYTALDNALQDVWDKTQTMPHALFTCPSLYVKWKKLSRGSEQVFELTNTAQTVNLHLRGIMVGEAKLVSDPYLETNFTADLFGINLDHLYMGFHERPRFDGGLVDLRPDSHAWGMYYYYGPQLIADSMRHHFRIGGLS